MLNSNNFHLDNELKDCIRDRLSNFDRQVIQDPDLVQSAVAFTIINADSASSTACFILTRRPKHLKRHKGQYALPGGRLDGSETPVQASLRELHEEIGIRVSNENVLGVLDDYATRSGFNITPVVVWGGQRDKLYPDKNEVGKLFRVPLSDLLSPDIPLLEQTNAGNAPVLSAPLKSIGHRIFAPTAAIMYQFREVALLGRPTRVAHYDQPGFAWK